MSRLEKWLAKPFPSLKKLKIKQQQINLVIQFSFKPEPVFEVCSEIKESNNCTTHRNQTNDLIRIFSDCQTLLFCTGKRFFSFNIVSQSVLLFQKILCLIAATHFSKTLIWSVHFLLRTFQRLRFCQPFFLFPKTNNDQKLLCSF